MQNNEVREQIKWILNESEAFSDTGDFRTAKEYLLEALDLAKDANLTVDIAKICSLTAMCCIELGELDEAYDKALSAISLYDSMGVYDENRAKAIASIGEYHFRRKEFGPAESNFIKALKMLRIYAGENDYYFALAETLAECEKMISRANTTPVKETDYFSDAFSTTNMISGIELCRSYYEEVGRPMLEKLFPEYLDRFACGLVGEGSDCFMIDDEWSRDHDWGPSFCIWVSDETYEEIGDKLTEAYENLPNEYMGYRRLVSDEGIWHRGVMTINSFYEKLLGCQKYEDIDWRYVPDASLAAATNGEVFCDPEGSFTKMRERLKKGYPENIRLLKIDSCISMFSQTGQYNYTRMLKRGDVLTADLMLSDTIKEAMKLQYYLENRYPYHDKWLRRGLSKLNGGDVLLGLLMDMMVQPGDEKIACVAEFLAKELYDEGIISDQNPYLDVHSDEIVMKASNTSLRQQ